MTSTADQHPERTSARRRLLDAAVDHVTAHGLGGLSLRALAEALGTSHRMLIYHFGSKEALLVEVVREVEHRQRTALADLVADPHGDRAEVARAFWDRLTDPALAPFERLFFEVYAHALRGSPWASGFLPGAVEEWLDPLTELIAGAGAATGPRDRHRARLGLAVFRGLLLDLLATGDRDAVRSALEEFLLLGTPGDTRTDR